MKVRLKKKDKRIMKNRTLFNEESLFDPKACKYTVIGKIAYNTDLFNANIIHVVVNTSCDLTFGIHPHILKKEAMFCLSCGRVIQLENDLL